MTEAYDPTNAASSPPTDHGGITIGDVKGDIRGTTIVGGDFNRVIYRRNSVDKEEQRNRKIILKRVKEFWVESILEKSLHGMAMLELGLVERPDAVDNPLNLILKTTAQPEQNQLLPPSTHIADIFNQMDGALLILGDPGSGKTMTLLELARQTITHAENDSTQPIPIVFNLSSWSTSNKSIAEWLVEEMKAKYKIPARIGQNWIKEGDLLLLLDGLDEVKPERREACVQAINEFSQEYGLKNIVICSRIADYEALTTRLKLQGAVLLQPLTPRQVGDYLERAGGQLMAVHTLLKEDDILQELTRSPLILSILTLAYREKSVQELRGFGSKKARRTHLFETYVNQMFNRTVRTKQQLYDKEQTTDWLIWLAQKLVQHNHSIFLMEGIQPGWLETSTQKLLYTLGSRLTAGLLIGLLMGLLFIPSFVLFFTLIYGMGMAEGLFSGLKLGMITTPGLGLIGLLIGLTGLLKREKSTKEGIPVVEALGWSWEAVRSRIKINFRRYRISWSIKRIL